MLQFHLCNLCVWVEEGSCDISISPLHFLCLCGRGGARNVASSPLQFLCLGGGGGAGNVAVPLLQFLCLRGRGPLQGCRFTLASSVYALCILCVCC